MSVDVVVELAGVTRVLAGCAEVNVPVKDGATWRDVIAALARESPELVGEAITDRGDDLMGSYMLAVVGRNTIADLDDQMSLGEDEQLGLVDVGIC